MDLLTLHAFMREKLLNCSVFKPSNFKVCFVEFGQVWGLRHFHTLTSNLCNELPAPWSIIYNYSHAKMRRLLELQRYIIRESSCALAPYVDFKNVIPDEIWISGYPLLQC